MISMEQITRWESEAEGYLGNEAPASLLMSKAEQQEFARRQIALIAEVRRLWEFEDFVDDIAMEVEEDSRWWRKIQRLKGEDDND